MKLIKSLIFGDTWELEEGKDIDALEAIKRQVSNYPINVFQTLNKHLNTLGFMITIDGEEPKSGTFL